MHEENPRLVYCSLKGYLKGPYESRPLMDEAGRWRLGSLYDGAARATDARGASIVDIGAATYAVVGVLAALLERQTTGQGQHVTGGLFETALFYVGQHMATTQMTGEDLAPMLSARSGPNRRGRAIYDLFDCKDGKQVFIGIVSDGQWQRLCATLGLEDLAEDPSLKHDTGRGQERDMLMMRIQQAVGGARQRAGR